MCVNKRMKIDFCLFFLVMMTLSLMIVPKTQADNVFQKRHREAIITAALDDYQASIENNTYVLSKNSSEQIKKRPTIDVSSVKETVKTNTPLAEIKKDTVKAASKFKGNVSGEVRVSAGFDTDDSFFNEAHFDLYERNWRVLSDEALNQRLNTYDPGIYQQLKFDVDVTHKELPVDMHAQVSIDPWSFTYTSDSLTLDTGWGTIADVEIFGWGNTGYAIGQSFRTQTGDLFNIPELKIKDGKIDGRTIGTIWGDTVTLPETDMDLTFQPIREFWFDVKANEKFKMRIFPYALEDQALISDDPMRLSGHKIYWENSPWINSWSAGDFHQNAGDSYTKGEWDDSLAFFTRDSDGLRLTALRGVSFEMQPFEATHVTATVASPKTLWQEYGYFDTVPASFRIKHFIDDDFYLGNVTGLHYGFDGEQNLDAFNVVTGFDFGKVFNDKTKIEGQISFSNSHYDITSEQYDSKKHGNAYYLSLTNSSDVKSDMIHRDYYNLRTEKKEGRSRRLTKLYYSYMDEDFESTLSNYHNTRKDSFWSRHIHFRAPFNDFFGSGKGQSLYDLEPFAIGDGIDYGRYVFGLRNETTSSDEKWNTLFDLHSAFHTQSNKHIETVTRIEAEYKANEKLRAKILGINQSMPKTTAGFDPYLYNATTGDFLENPSISGGDDPSTNTLSAGAEYDFTDKITGHAIWEYTNDLYATASDNFPRGLFLSTWSADDYLDNGNTYMVEHNSLYGQDLFDLPPYAYRNILHLGLDFTPNQKWNFYLDYAQNPNQFAGPIDGNMSHVSLESTYMHSERLGFFFKYTWSRMYDLEDLLNGELDYRSHHNFFAEVKYKIDADSSFLVEYGVGPSQELKTSSFDPYSNAQAALDTRHILRIFYTKKF